MPSRACGVPGPLGNHQEWSSGRQCPAAQELLQCAIVPLRTTNPLLDVVRLATPACLSLGVRFWCYAGSYSHPISGAMAWSSVYKRPSFVNRPVPRCRAIHALAYVRSMLNGRLGR